MKNKVPVIIWCTLLLILLGILFFFKVNASFNIESNILKLLPKTETDIAIELAFENFSEINMKQLVFLLENKDKSEAIKSVDQLAKSLEESPWIEDVILNISSQDQTSIAQFNHEYRYQLLTDEDAALLKTEAYESFSDDVVQQAYSAFSGGVVNLIKTDPFLLSYRFALANSSSELENFKVDDGHLVAATEQGYAVLLRATLVQSPFDQSLQKQLIGRITGIEQAWNNLGNNSRLIKTGALFYTEFAYSSARNEITTIGGSSLLLILFIIVITFFSIRPILLVTLALSFGILLGFVAVRLIFGEVHLLTFVFGASLIGVAVDYAFHYFAVEQCDTGEQRLRRIFPAITLGLTSSIIGYLALLLTPFPGLQQMALFCIVGLLGAYLTVVLFFPVVPLVSTCSENLLSLCEKLLRLGRGKFAPVILMVGMLLPVAAVYLVISDDSSRDDIRQFQAIDPELQRQEEAIQNALNSPAANQFYLVKGGDPETLLGNLEKATQSLDLLVGSRVIESYVGVSKWLPSIQKQRENYSLYQLLFESGVHENLINLGLITDAEYSQAENAFNDDEDRHLYPNEWLNSPLGKQFSSLWLGEINGEYVSVIGIRGINDLNALDDIDESIIFVDKVSTISKMLASYRESTTVLLLVAALFIFIVLALRYGLRKAGIMISSPLISVSASIVGLAILGEAFSLFNVLALFLVVGIGIDFGIFFVESEKANSNTLLAIFLSALTTIFSFGLLSLSSTSVIHSFGLTMLIGISMAFVLSPIIGNLIVKERTEVV